MNHPFLVQIDHVGIYSEQPETLFRFFTQALGLPVAFPLVSYPAYTTGSVALGNCFLEITKLGSPPKPAPPPFAARYQILGFLVERERLQHSLRELQQRQVVHSGVLPFFAPEATDANPIIMWENVYLGNLLGTNFWQRLFLSMSRRSPAKPSSQRSPLMQRLAAPLLLRAFLHGRPVLTAYHTNLTEHARAINRETLQACAGGGLGIIEVSHVHCSTPDASAWTKLLGNLPVANQFNWSLGDGPALHLTVNQPPALQSITLRVAKLADAHDQLVRLGITVVAAHDWLRFTVPHTHGLQMRLTEFV